MLDHLVTERGEALELVESDVRGDRANEHPLVIGPVPLAELSEGLQGEGVIDDDEWIDYAVVHQVTDGVEASGVTRHVTSFQVKAVPHSLGSEGELMRLACFSLTVNRVRDESCSRL